jgi:hypothetical protein
MNYEPKFTNGRKECQGNPLRKPQSSAMGAFIYNEAMIFESPANPNRDAMPCTARLPPYTIM